MIRQTKGLVGKFSGDRRRNLLVLAGIYEDPARGGREGEEWEKKSELYVCFYEWRERDGYFIKLDGPNMYKQKWGGRGVTVWRRGVSAN